MEYRVIYCDVLFLIDFSMDFLVLYITAALLLLPRRAWRLALSATLGALYEVAATVLPGKRGIALILHILVSIVICAIAFDFPRMKCKKMRTVLIFYFVNLLFGGAAMAAVYLVSRLPYRSDAYHSKPSAFYILFSAVLCALLLFVCIKRRIRHASGQIRVTVEWSGCKKMIDCLIDSGNLPTEQFSGLPVILCSREALLAHATPPPAVKRRVIPAKTVNGESLLEGFLPDRIILHREGETPELKQAVIGFTEKEFSRTASSEIQGLIPAVLLEN